MHILHYAVFFIDSVFVNNILSTQCKKTACKRFPVSVE